MIEEPFKWEKSEYEIMEENRIKEKYQNCKKAGYDEEKTIDFIMKTEFLTEEMVKEKLNEIFGNRRSN